MINLGNQYADKVYSEHPIALWPLDDDAYYISLINNNHRQFTNWTLTGATASNTPTLPEDPAPFNSDIFSSITASSTSAGTITAISPATFGATDISTDVSTFCVNFFLYQKPDFINWFQIGYEYMDALGATHQVLSDQITKPDSASWLNFNKTYSLPTSWSGDIKLIIKIDFADSSGGDASSRTVIMNGLSVGQNSETTCYSSLGNFQSILPEDLGFNELYGISADQYGVLSDNGYYTIRNNRLLASNDGFPIIYGVNQSTKILPSNVNLPSLLFPGKGMLNNSGRNKTYTLETWIKINPSTAKAKKILGPISSNDGIYVKEGFLTLVIGNEIGSHCVGEWYRPMLVHLILKQNNAVVLLNGEQVISIPFNRMSIDLPLDKDWWGVYSYESIGTFLIDAISIYPYEISTITAKKRFVYGQGTPSIQSIDTGFQGTPTTIDFATSEYNSNVIYPDIARWDAAYFNNLNATTNYISVPNYSLPIINIGGRSISEWYADNYTINTLEYPNSNHPNFITFRPNISYDVNGDPIEWDQNGTNYNEQAYFNFPSINVLNNPVVAAYGIFEIEQDIASTRTLMSFVNVINGQSFDITVNGDTIDYSINGEVLHSEIVTLGIENLVGINFEQSGIAFGYKVSQFFSSPSSIQLYVGGNGINTFEGKIYSVGFCNQTNFDKVSSNFAANGLTIPENYNLLFDHIASYTLLPEYEYGQLFLDISVDSEWEEYYPLSFFASYVKDEQGNPVYDLDTLQLNVGYSFVETGGVWTYQQFLGAYSSLTYADISTDYATYFDLYKNNTGSETINVSNSSLQAYLTFQEIASGANAPLSTFQYSKALSPDFVIDPDAENSVSIPDKAYKTKFSFADNVIVYPPKSKNFEEYAMVIHFNIKQRAILKNPLKIRSLEITSNNLNYVSSSNDPIQKNSIGTKFGTKIYPYVLQDAIEDYKEKNPLLIYKTGTPYLYTTEKSGIELIRTTGIDNPSSSQYIAEIPVNSAAAYQVTVGAIQLLSMMKAIPEGETKFADIVHKNGTITLVVDSSAEGNFITAYNNVNSTLTPYTNIVFYQNGRYVVRPKLVNGDWNAIGIAFPAPLDFDEYAGSIKLYGGFLFNNISYYLSEGLGVKTDLSIRSWQTVLNSGGANKTWLYWYENAESWQDVYILGQNTVYATTPADIYGVYTGTNRFVVDDGYGLQFSRTSTLLISDATWTTITAKPA